MGIGGGSVDIADLELETERDESIYHQHPGRNP